MKYVYPAIFTQSSDGYDVSFPDLPGCLTCADTLADAIEMAEDAATTWLWAAENDGYSAPQASQTVAVDSNQFVNFIIADTEEFRRQMDSRAVKKTLTIPAWLNHKAEEAHLNFSGILQEALKQRLSL